VWGKHVKCGVTMALDNLFAHCCLDEGQRTVVASVIEHNEGCLKGRIAEE